MRTFLLSCLVLTFVASSGFGVDKSAIDVAVQKGVAALKQAQQSDGTWAYEQIGATALCTLALIEGGVEKTDKSVTSAAEACRKVALTTSSTYSLALLILLFDVLDNPNDTPLIEAMLINLWAGQNTAGCWAYECPKGFTADELAAITAEATGKAKNGRSLDKLPAKGNRTIDNLPAYIQAKVKTLERSAGFASSYSDNSNTQFANLGLWVGRRYGVPTQTALARIDAYYRKTQGQSGGWGYQSTGMQNTQFDTSTAPMTCAGALGLITGNGVKADSKKDKDGVVTIDVSNDKQLGLALTALSNAIGVPTGWDGKGKVPQNAAFANGKAFYFLWSLERTCVLLGVDTLGKKDWYAWGAEVLLASQRPDGTWEGEYHRGCSDTCFAILFLRKANFFRDLRNGKDGRMKDPVVRTLKGGGSLKGEKGLVPIDIGARPKDKAEKNTEEEKKPKTPEEKAAAKLVEDLHKAKDKERAGILKELRDSKGAAFTEALADAIKRLDGQAKKDTREALADRLTRMKATTLREFFKEEVELRRAAAIAAGQRDAKELVPDLIKLLDDPEPLVQRAARAALEAISGKKLGDRPGPWQDWWKTQTKE